MVPSCTKKIKGAIEKSQEQGKQNKKMLVIGPTGSGKTTTLNSMMNYLWKVKFEDEHRYQLIQEVKKEGGQTVSQTDDVMVYYIEPPDRNYTYTIIDTPGYGDTRGIEQDEIITKKIKHFFENEIDSLTAICFVVCSTQTRLTATQKYVFDQMINIFGKDIGDNIFIMFTFCDAKRPPALEAIKEKNIPFKKWFRFNNSAFFLDYDGSDLSQPVEMYDNEGEGEGEQEDAFHQHMDKMFYDMGISAFHSFFSLLDTQEDKSLTLTKEVLDERERLLNFAAALRADIQFGLSKLQEFNTTQEQIEHHKDLINQNKEFEWTEKRTVYVDQLMPKGEHTTTCMNCHRTCHRRCAYMHDNDKARCCAMDGKGYCTVCADKCHWSAHKNTPFEYVQKIEEFKRTSEELKGKYFNATSGKSKLEQFREGIERDIQRARRGVKEKVEQARKCANRINEIALNPSAYQTVEYFDLLIQSAKEERKPGWQQYVEQLVSLRDGHEFLKQVISKPDFNPLPSTQEV